MNNSESELHIYTALTVPTVTSHASVKTVQWTPDGQLCLTTKLAAYIMVRSATNLLLTFQGLG